MESVVGKYREIGHGIVTSDDPVNRYGSEYRHYTYQDGKEFIVPADYEFSSSVSASCVNCGRETPHTEFQQHGKWAKKQTCLLCGEAVMVEDLSAWSPTDTKKKVYHDKSEWSQ